MSARNAQFGESLTGRECEVYGHLSDGLTAKETAERMGIHWRTVQAHKDSLLKKCGARNSAHLVKIIFSGVGLRQ